MTEIFIGLNNDIIINLHLSMDRVDYCPIRNTYISKEREDLDHIYDRIETSEKIYHIISYISCYNNLLLIFALSIVKRPMIIFSSKPF